MRHAWLVLLVVVALSAPLAEGGADGAPSQGAPSPPLDPLPAWNEGAAKTAILAFVASTTTPSSASYVPPEERIATFDQDGTLWTEHPLYTQAVFEGDRLRQLVGTHPEWRERPPVRTALSNDREAMARLSRAERLQILTLTHAGTTTEQFPPIVDEWMSAARDPRWHRPYTDLVYEPMLEVMQYLRANGFETYIVTGSGQAFVRSYAQRTYGVAPEQVVGSSLITKYAHEAGEPVLVQEPRVLFVDDGPGKPAGIELFIGRRPRAAFGNSDGDREMLEWTTAAKGARFALLVLHDDGEREYAYGPAAGLPETKVGAFSEALLREARSRGWTVVSMKNDWKRVFAFQP